MPVNGGRHDFWLIGRIHEALDNLSTNSRLLDRGWIRPEAPKIRIDVPAIKPGAGREEIVEERRREEGERKLAGERGDQRCCVGKHFMTGRDVVV